jgi:hypothetical protein
MSDQCSILETRQEVASLIAAANRRLLARSRPAQEASVRAHAGRPILGDPEAAIAPLTADVGLGGAGGSS